MKEMWNNIRYLYQHKTTVYIIRRDFDQLIWQLDRASSNKTEISNLKIKQPSWISRMTITHYFPDEFTADYTSHFICRKGPTNSHLKGIIEKLPDDQLKLTIRRVPSFQVAYLVLPLLLLISISLFLRDFFTHHHNYVPTAMLLCVLALIIYVTLRILASLEGLCIDYIKSGKELTI